MLNILVIIGSIRDNRVGEKVAKWFYDVASKRTDMKAELVDLKAWNLPIFHAGTPPSQAGGKYDDPQVQKWAQKIASADGYVFVTAEYNHALPSALKNAIDHLYPEWKHKAAAIVSYGGAAGGTRAAEHLRQIAPELHMATARESITMPGPWSMFDESGNLKDRATWDPRAETVLNDLVWWANALKRAREKV